MTTYKEQMARKEQRRLHVEALQEEIAICETRAFPERYARWVKHLKKKLAALT